MWLPRRWLILLDYVFVPSLLYIFVGNWCQSLIPQIPGWVWILIFIAVNTAINIKGIETTARVDMFFFVVEIGIVLIIVIGGLKYVLGGGGAGELTMTPIYQADKVNLTFIATACTIAALNFTGFDGISTLAEEVSEPEKNVGRAILIALVVIGTVFFLQTYIVCLIEPDYNKFNASTALFDACARRHRRLVPHRAARGEHPCRGHRQHPERAGRVQPCAVLHGP